MGMDIILKTRIEKAAQDNGFDIQLSVQSDWLAFSSSHCPLKVWMTGSANSPLTLALSDRALLQALGSSSTIISASLPEGAMAAFNVPDLDSLYIVLKRAFQLSRALPSEPLNEFRKATQSMPQSTEIERTVIQRVGQDIFRERLIDFWDGKCAVTGLSIQQLLRASHIKPWAKCDSDAERLDVFNGLLLAPHIDALFDRGFVSFEDDGAILISSKVGAIELSILSVSQAMKCHGILDDHRKYLTWHRKHEFQK